MNFIGNIPWSFPYDPPDEVDFIFSKWQNGFPFRADFHYHDNGISGPGYEKPLYWNPGTGKFQDAPP
jgi:hypothetical protein